MTRTTTRRTGGRFQNAAKWIAMGIYLLGLLAFLLAEMGVPWLVSLRATNQRILIFVLIFLPFVLPAAASVIQTLSLRISGQELRLEMREIEQEMRESVTRVAGEFDGRIGLQHRRQYGRETGAHLLLPPFLFC